MQSSSVHVAPALGTAAPTPVSNPGLPPDQWNQITENVLANGTYRPPDRRIPGTMGLELKRGNPVGTRTANYANLWGYKGSDGVFRPRYGTFVSEHWVLEEDGNFHIEQWLHRIELDGSHQRATHVTMVQTPSRRVLEYKSRGVPVDDPQAAQSLAELGALWSGFAPMVKPSGSTDAGREAAFMLNPRAQAPLHLNPPTR